MTKYVCLLRGINVGGNALVKMSDLKQIFEKEGFTAVSTYINSGNVIFTSTETNQEKLTTQIEKMLVKALHMPLQVVIVSHIQLQHIVSDSPALWKKPNDIRMYVAFLKAPTTPQDVIKEIPLKEDIDAVKAGRNVVYMSTKLSGLTKSGINKLAAQKIYKEMTIRNFNTTRKLLTLMGGK